MSERWERECQALKAEVTALQQQLQALTAQPVGVNAPARRRVSRSVKWLLSICILLGGGGVLYVEGAMDALFIDKDGRVGIGNNSPQHLLHVGNGTSSIPKDRVSAVIASQTNDAGIAIAQKDQVNVLVQAAGAGGYLGTNSDHPLVLGTNSQDRVTIDKGGKVGVGTEKPEGFQVSLPEDTKPINPQPGVTLGGGPKGNASIEVRNNGTGTPYIDFAQKVDSDFDARIRLTAPGKLAIEGAALGIGTPAPEHRVDIRSNGDRSAFTIDNALYLGNRNGTVSISNNAFVNDSVQWQIKDAQKKAFTIELRDSGMLELYGTATNGQADWQKLATFDGANKKIVFPVALNLSSSLSVSGDIWYQGHKFVLATGMFKNSYNVEATSDQRLKKDITPLTHAAEKVRRLSAVTYHWNDDGLRHFTRDIESTVSAGPQATLEEHQKAWQAEREKRYQALASTNVGVLAQEVEAVLPEAVSTDENGYKSVKYHYLTALLIAAFKEQENAAQAQARIVEQHEQEIARLRAATRIVYQSDPERAGQLPHAVQAQ